MSKFHSVNSNVTNQTWNTCNTADQTVQAGNTKTTKQKFQLIPPRIIEEDSNSILSQKIYDLSGSASSSVSYSSRKSTGGSSRMSSREIKYDLSGARSGSQLRKDMKKALGNVDVRDEGPGEGNLTKDQYDEHSPSWFSFFFCYNNDTTVPIIKGDNESRSFTTMDTNTDSESMTSLDQSRRLSSVGDATPEASLRSSSRSLDSLPPKTPSSSRHSSLDSSSDALLLEQFLNDVTVTSSKKCRRKGLPPGPPSLGKNDEKGSLDIVMELQLEEDLMKSKKKRGVFRKKRKGGSSAKKKSEPAPSSKPHSNVSNNDTYTSAGAIKSALSDRSLFSFATTNPIATTPKQVSTTSQSKSRNANIKNSSKRVYMSGPKNGTFLNITTKITADDVEVIDTYDRFRASDQSVEMVLNRISTSVPLYHWKGNQSFRFGCVSTSVDSEDLGLSSLSSLELGSTSMISLNDGELPNNLKNVCSEPSAKGFIVRSSTYLQNSRKAPSDETIFALLGADSVMKAKKDDSYSGVDVCKSPDSYFNRLKAANTKTPFLIVINFVVPWGNLISYYYRPDATGSGPFCAERENHPSEKLWKAFMNGDTEFRNNALKFIPRVIVGPWALKKLVGTQPALIGQKIPTSYYGSVEEGYIEVCMDVTKGGKMANSICSAVASKANSVTIDLAFLLQGSEGDELPEQLLSVIRLHHVSLKKKKHRTEI